jgi:hypothetical protein
MTRETPPRDNYYTEVFDTLQARIAGARDLDGVEPEIALIRGRLHDFMNDHPKDLEPVIKCVRLITRAVADHYRMHPRDRNRLEGEALARVRELAAQFGPPEEDDV